jgi:NAD(P)-dependent dehydrogenase (short-subunit alcohol dehydrogenase family)
VISRGSGRFVAVVSTASRRVAAALGYILSRADRSPRQLRNVDGVEPHQRLGRLVEPDEIAAAVGWLCGSGSAAVAGAIRVDGGYVG